jgi:transcriptional regulator with XRE-family HTH domain
MSRRRAPTVRNRLAALLRQRGITWGELGRRTLLPPRLVARLRSPAANPRLAVAERVAAALGVPIERLWRLAPRPRRR